MNEDTKKRYELLKKKQQEQMKSSKWQHNNLFMECVQKLNEVEMISDEQCKLIIGKISAMISLYSSGHINWSDTKYKKNRIAYSQLGNYVDTLKDYYIIWDNYDLPAIKCKLQYIINNSDDVEAVSFSYLIISENFNVIMESEKFGYLNVCII